MYSFINGRNPRNKTQMYIPMHHPFGNYCTEALQKSEMKLNYENEIFLNNLHLIPDPLMKNLADTLLTSEKPEKLQKQCLNAPKMTKPTEEARTDTPLAGITSFFSGVFNMLSGAVFRTRSPVDYYDCYDDARQGSPSSWRRANDDQDKNGQPEFSCDGSNLNGALPDMNNREIGSCEQKLNQVRSLLSKPVTNKQSNIWRKRPKKVFVEPGSIEDSFEDAFSPEDFVSLSNDPHMEYRSLSQYQNEELCETETPKTKIDIAPVNETVETVKEVTNDTTTQKHKSCDKEDNNDTIKTNDVTSKNSGTKLDSVTSINNDESVDEKQQLVSSCEHKLSKLKALLRDKRTKNTKIMTPTPEPVAEQARSKTIPISKPIDKHYKNPNRMLDKRHKMKIKRSIQDDVIFASEVDLDSPADSPSTPSTINSSDTSLGDYFDEMKGRFRTTSVTESEDSFQIVFNDSPKLCRASDCESEDSFIVFEDTDCYTSNDVFGESDSESEVSDSGCGTMTCKLSHSLSRTVSNLTDDTLYESSDEVDCARVDPVGAKGLLMDAEKKRLKKDQPAKKVHFSTEPPKVKVMRVWAFAARQARPGHWERFVLDRERFKRRIADVDMAVSWVLKPQHRKRVMFQRFMPLWNRQKRQELADKKEKEAEDKRNEEVRLEVQRLEDIRQEEIRIEEERQEMLRIEKVKEDEKRIEEERQEEIRLAIKRQEELRLEEIRQEEKRIEEARRIEKEKQEEKRAEKKRQAEKKAEELRQEIKILRERRQEVKRIERERQEQVRIEEERQKEMIIKGEKRKEIRIEEEREEVNRIEEGKEEKSQERERNNKDNTQNNECAITNDVDKESETKEDKNTNATKTQEHNVAEVNTQNSTHDEKRYCDDRKGENDSKSVINETESKTGFGNKNYCISNSQNGSRLTNDNSNLNGFRNSVIDKVGNGEKSNKIIRG